jgi:hypothetical protein
MSIAFSKARRLLRRTSGFSKGFMTRRRALVVAFITISTLAQAAPPRASRGCRPHQIGMATRR